MSRNIKYSSSRTNDSVSEENAKFTPFLYLGHPDGYTSSNYDIFDATDSLKWFYLFSDSVRNAPALRLDTNSLYFGAEYANDISSLNSVFTSDAGDGELYNPVLGLPVRFQRVHFRAHRGWDGEVAEYYAIFLVGDPVRISNIDVIGADYINEKCAPLTYPHLCSTDKEEQTSSNIALSSWNTTIFSAGLPVLTPLSFSGRMIMGDSLISQMRAVRDYEELYACKCHFDPCDASTTFVLGIPDGADKVPIGISIDEITKGTLEYIITNLINKGGPQGTFLKDVTFEVDGCEFVAKGSYHSYDCAGGFSRNVGVSVDILRITIPCCETTP